MFINQITLHPSSYNCIVIAIVIIHHTQFDIKYLTAPLNWLGNVTGACYLTEGSVSIGACYAAAGGIEFADVLG